MRASRKCASRAERIAQQNLENIESSMSDLSIRVETTKEAVRDARDQVAEGTAAVRAEIIKSSNELSNNLQLFRSNVAQNLGTILQS
jgi:hypothetical protein